MPPSKKHSKTPVEETVSVPPVAVTETAAKRVRKPAVKKQPAVVQSSKMTFSKRVKLGNVRKISATPMSPKTLNRKITCTTDSLSSKDLRAVTANITRSISRISQISSALGKAGPLGEVVTSTGEKMTKDDLVRLINETSNAIKHIPKAAQRSNKKHVVEITDQERTERIAGLVTKTTKGIRTLFSTLKNKQAETLILEKKIDRLNKLMHPSRPNSGDQISTAFYISDQLRFFFEGANLGNGIALFYPGVCTPVTRAISGHSNFDAAVSAVITDLKASGIQNPDPIKDLGGRDAAIKLADPRNIIRALVIERGIATSPLLMSLMALYILANGLKSSDGRIVVDSHMMKYFGEGNDTRSVIAGTDLTSAAEKISLELSGDAKSDEGIYAAKAAKVFSEIKDKVPKSGLQRLEERKSESVKVDSAGNTTITRSMSITLAFYYRIRWIPKNMDDDLMRESVKNIAYGVKTVFVN